MFEELGIPVANDKLEGRKVRPTFLGFELDTIAMKVAFPSKFSELKQLVNWWRTREACCQRDLESLVGKLAHAAQVVQSEKTFLRMLASRRKANNWCRLNSGFRSDIMWWATFLESWNGMSMMRGEVGTCGASI